MYNILKFDVSYESTCAATLVPEFFLLFITRIRARADVRVAESTYYGPRIPFHLFVGCSFIAMTNVHMLLACAYKSSLKR